MEYILIIDIGNSFTKVGIYQLDKDKNEKIVLFETNKSISTFAIENKLNEFKDFNVKHVILGSVVPELKEKFFNAIIKIFDINPYLINQSTKYSFELTDSIRKEVGDDLLALSEYCCEIGNNVLGFSFGTAIASVFIKDKRLTGVFISPGLTFGLNHLIKKASLLQELKISNKSNLVYGDNTIKSLEAGIHNLRRGVVMSSYEYHFKHEKIEDLKCVISGGEGFNIDPVDFKYEINPEAILLGFKKIYLINNQK